MSRYVPPKKKGCETAEVQFQEHHLHEIHSSKHEIIWCCHCGKQFKFEEA